MRWFWITLSIVLIVFGGGYFLLQTSSPVQEFSIESNRSNMPMTLKSNDFNHNGSIPPKFTCDGDNINPHLEIVDIPQGTQSLALIMHDPDAPREGGRTHWTMWNMDPSIAQIEDDSVPEGAVQGTTSSGDQGYGGPCPPSGTHHYNFTLYALSAKLDIDASAGKEELQEAMKDLIISQTTLTGLYSRE